MKKNTKPSTKNIPVVQSLLEHFWFKMNVLWSKMDRKKSDIGEKFYNIGRI